MITMPHSKHFTSSHSSTILTSFAIVPQHECWFCMQVSEITDRVHISPVRLCSSRWPQLFANRQQTHHTKCQRTVSRQRTHWLSEHTESTPTTWSRNYMHMHAYLFGDVPMDRRKPRWYSSARTVRQLALQVQACSMSQPHWSCNPRSRSYHDEIITCKHQNHPHFLFQWPDFDIMIMASDTRDPSLPRTQSLPD